MSRSVVGAVRLGENPPNDKPSHRRRAYRLELSGKSRAHLQEEERREEQANIAEHEEAVTALAERDVGYDIGRHSRVGRR